MDKKQANNIEENDKKEIHLHYRKRNPNGFSTYKKILDFMKRKMQIKSTLR